MALVQSTRDWLSIWANGAGFDDCASGLAGALLSYWANPEKSRVGENQFCEGRFKTISGARARLLLEDLNWQTAHEISSGSIIEIKGQ